MAEDPGGAPTPDNVINVPDGYDYGPTSRYSDESGVIPRWWPSIKQIIPTPAPGVDEDGKRDAGVRSWLRAGACWGTTPAGNPVAAGALKATKVIWPRVYSVRQTKAARLASGDRAGVSGRALGSQKATTGRGVSAIAKNESASAFCCRRTRPPIAQGPPRSPYCRATLTPHA